MKLNSDDQTLAENKIMIMYILQKVDKKISYEALLDLVSTISDMNYFYFQQFLLDLQDDGYIVKTEDANTTYYELTENGKNSLDLTIDILPGILKLNIDSQFKKSMNEIKDKFAISAEYIPINEKEATVRCKIIDNNEVIFDLQLHAGSKEQAKKIVENWNTKSTEIYPEIFKLLKKKKKLEPRFEFLNFISIILNSSYLCFQIVCRIIFRSFRISISYWFFICIAFFVFNYI